MHPALRYLLSTGNLVGCAAAAVVAELFLTGVIASWWFPLAAVAYAAGALAFWRPAPKTLKPGLDTADYLAWLRSEALPKLPPEAGQRLERILDMAAEVWPRLKDLQAQGLVQVENRSQLKQTLTMFLPELVTNYLKLPTAYARTYKVDGKTPLMLMNDQLDLLETHVRDIRDHVYAKDIDSLLSHGKFLREKLDSTLKLG